MALFRWSDQDGKSGFAKSYHLPRVGEYVRLPNEIEALVVDKIFHGAVGDSSEKSPSLPSLHLVRPR